MKKKLFTLSLAVLLALLPVCALAETVVASFYPIYLFALNLTDGLPDVAVRCLAAPTTGCLHDYQLQTGDMKALSAADVFLINGAGMEGFLSNVFDTFPALPVVDASEGIELMADEEHGEMNAHVWLDASNARQMVDNLAAGLMAALSTHADAIAANRDAYATRLSALDEELQAGLCDLPRKDIVTFHEAFPYFAEAYGLNVAAVITREPGDALSPAKMGELIELVRGLGAPPLFVEPQYEDIAAQTISRETGAPVYTLDPVVTGPEEDVPLDYYETVMRQNMQVLQEAFGD